MAILYYCSANHGTRSLFAGSRKLIVINSFEFIFIVFYILDSAVKSLGAYVGEFSEGSEQKKKNKTSTMLISLGLLLFRIKWRKTHIKI